jgi:glycosyltransferase involved in cell wall biosynthesis
MPDTTVFVVVPGDLEARTGGYGYDRQIVAGLRQRGWTVHVVNLAGNYPSPSQDERAAAARALAAIPEGARVLVDGLAFGVLPAEAGVERARLRLTALVHHPLGLETGLDASMSERLLASERQALTSARGVIVTSTPTVDAVRRLGVEAERIAVVEPGTDPAPIAHGSGGGLRQLLCVASIVPRKGYDVLLRALERLARFEWHLTCVGSMERDSAYARAVAAHAGSPLLQGRVSLPGELSGASLDAAYAASDLFVLPTHYEGYGMAVAEALARGIPVVSTPTGAIPVLVGRDAGILVEAGDVAGLAQALESLFADAAAYARLRAGARRARTSIPDWDRAVRQMEAALLRTAP